MPSTAADSAIVNPVTIDGDYIHVVAAIIWKQGARSRFLIAQRQRGKHLQGYWEFPGGKLEAGESPRQALQRELQEEINILPTQASPYMRVYYRYPERNILLDTWLIEAYRGDIAPGEQQLLRWIEVSQADDYQFPPADIPIIEAIRNSVKAKTRRLP
jgi:8-oxo-dGTP diphosphatase